MLSVELRTAFVATRNNIRPTVNTAASAKRSSKLTGEGRWLVIDRGYVDFFRTCQFGLIEHGNGCFGRGFAVCLYDHRHWLLSDQTGYSRANASDPDFASAIENLSSRGHSDQDAVFLEILLSRRARLVDFNPGLLNEDGRDLIAEVEAIDNVNKAYPMVWSQLRTERPIGLANQLNNITNVTVSASDVPATATVQSVAADLGPDGHLINAILPGVLDTPMTRTALSSEQIASVTTQTPTKRLATVQDVCNLAYFLTSNANNGITGQFIRVDGGFSDIRLFQ